MNTCTTLCIKKLVAFCCVIMIACCCLTTQTNAQQLPKTLQLTGNNLVAIQTVNPTLLLSGASQCDCSSFSVCITSQVNNTCYGGNYGSATASASGGTQPYSYSWNTNPVQKTAKATGLADGTYTVTVTDNMGCTATACVTITGGTPITIVITGQPTSNSCSGYFSVTQGGWGTACHGGNPGCYRDANFATCFPNGLTIGCTNTYTFTSSSAIQNFLPSGGTPSALPTGNATNPTSAGNTFAGQLVAATLNVGFDNCDPNFAPATGNLGNLLIASGEFAGWTVNQVIAVANQVIGGCSTAYSASDLTNALDGINSSYDGGTATGFLVCPSSICNSSCETLTICGTSCTTYKWSPSNGLSASTGTSVIACPTVTTTYTVTGTDKNGCTGTGIIVVTVNPPTTITINTPAPICKGNCATLTVNGAPCVSYTWSPSTGLSATTGSSVQACPTATTTYTVTGSDHNGCPATGTVVVTVNTTTTITVNTPAPICKGNCATLTVNGAPCVSYTWSPSTGLSATTGSSVQACPTTTTTYTVTGSDHNGCPASGTVVVTVNPTTTITVNTPAPICKGNCATLTVNGAPCVSYTWSPSTGLSATTGSSVQACPTTTTTYTVTGSDHNGCPASGTVVVIVNPTTTITVNTPAPICSGNCATLTVNGAPCVSYTWSPSTGLSATTGSSVQACPTVNTTYTVTGSDHNGCPASGTVVVTVNTPSVISSSPAKVCAGNCAILTVTGASTYTWSPSAGLSATTGSSVQACPTASTTYTITGTNSNNCVSTTTTTVTVYPLPVLSSSPATVCAGNCAILTVTGASTYTWSPSTGLSATTGSSVQACPTASTTYTITGRNSTDLGNGCSSTTTTVVHVNPLPTVSVTATKQTVCSGTSDTLTATGATSYTWSPAAGLSATVGSVVYANPTVNTTYTVTGTNGTNCSNTATVVVNIYPSPTVAITVSSASLCNGAADTLTASGGTTYTWSPSAGLNVTTGSQVIATPTVSTTYTVIGISNVGCTSLSAGFTAITVNNPPVLTSAPATICSGSCANLTVTGADTYTWSPSTGLSATTGSSVQACPTITTTYTITGTTTAGCVGTTTTVVTVNYKPVITVQPRSNTMCAVNGQCDGHTFCVTATGINLSYQWYFKGQPIPGANQTCYSFSPGTFADTGKYFVTVSNQCGTDTSDTVIFILINQPEITSPPANVSVCLGNSAQFCVQATGTALNYQWQFKGKNITNANDTCFTINSTSLSDTGTYDVIVSGLCGADTAYAKLTVDTIKITVNSAVICLGNSATLTASGAATYTWSPATGLSATTGSSVTANPTTNTTYTVTGTSGKGCVGTAIATVKVNPLPVLSSSPATVCAGNCAQLTVTGARSYTWSPSTGLSVTTGSAVQACPTVTTTYTITGINNGDGGDGCIGTTTTVVTVDTLPVIVVPPATICNGNSATLTASGATTYTWSPATGLSATTGSSVIANPTATTTYTITGVNGNSCSGSTTTIVHVNPIPVLSASPARVCKGTCTPLTVTGASFYTWSPSTGLSATTGSSVQACPTATTTYTITGTSSSQCVGTTTTVVTVDTLPVIVAPPATICNGNSATLTASGATTYTWSPATGLSATTGSSVLATPTATTTYTVTGINGNGCTGSTTTIVHVNPIPVLSASPARVCKGTCAPLTVTGASFYTWSPSTGLSATTGSSVQACPTVTTTYTITGISSTQCVGTTTTVVTVDTLPVIVAPPATICSGNSTKLTASGANTYTWSPATGLSATTGSSVIANPTASTTYTVTGINGNGCSGSTTTVVTVDTLPVIVAPPATICYGNSTQLTASGATTYTWSPATGLSATTGATVTANPTATTTYTITGANGNNCSSSTTTVVTVDTLPVIVAPPATICYGNSTELTASGATTYTWSPATGLSATTGATVLATPTATTTYTVTGINGNGCSGSTTTIVTVDTLPVIVANPGRICRGNSTELTASGANTYTWSPATGLSATTGATVTASPTATTTYTIVGINGNGCTGSTTTIVTVDTLPILSAPAAEVCIGSCATLTVSGATNYTWSPAAGLSATTGSSVLACPTASTTYTIVGTNGTGCVATTTTTVKVDTLPVLKVTANPNPICLGNSTTITATGANNYTWSPATGLSATTGSSVIANPTVTTTYKVIGTNSNGCVCNDSIVIIVHTPPVLSSAPATICVGQCAPLTVTGAATYTWSPSTGLSATTGSSVTACPTANVTYTITGTNIYGCVGTTTTSVTVDTLPQITLVQSSDSICVGSTDTIWPSGATSYTWKPAVFTLEGLPYVVVSPTVTTTYTVTGSNGNGCTDSTTFVVTVDTLPVVVVPPARICNGNSTELTASGATTYTWSPATGLSATTGATVLATPTATTTYTIVGTNSHGCSASTTTIVTVDTIPVIVVPPAIICSGNSTQLTASGANTYTWSPATGLSATTGATVTATPTATTTYTVTGINGNGCTGSTTTVVTVDTLPVIVVPPATICSGNSTQLTASGATTYTWSPTTGLSATTGATVTATPTATTTYTITGANGNNCSSSTTTIVTVDTLPVIVAPPATICYGNSTELTASGATTYTWSPATGLSATTGATVTANPTATTTYTITGINGNGCTGSTTTVVTVDSLPAITVPPATICDGNSTVLSVNGGGSGSQITLPNGDVTNVFVSSLYPTTGFIGYPEFDAIDWTNQGVQFTARSFVSFDLSGIPAGSAITGATLSLFGDSVNSNHQGSTGQDAAYLQLITSSWTASSTTWNNQPGTTTTDEVSLKKTATDSIYENKPDINVTSLISDLYNNPSTYHGLMLRLQSEVLGNSLVFGGWTNTKASVRPVLVINYSTSGGGSNTYTWSPATGLSATTGSSVTANPTVTTTYTIIAVNANGCSDTTTTVVTVDTLPVIVAPPATICYGNSTQLTASGATTYTWSPATGLSATTGATVTANPTATTTYTITGANGNNCSSSTTTVVTVDTLPVIVAPPATICYGNSTELTASGATTYTWSPAKGLSATTGATVLATPTATTTYTVTGINGNGCSGSTTTIVTVDTLPVIVANPGRICRGNSTELTASGANTYTWSPATGLSATTGATVTASPTATTTYTIVGINGNGCTGSTTTIVTVDTLPILSAPAAEVCIGSCATLTVSGATNYTWSPAAGLSATTGSSVLACPTASTTYTIVGSNGTGCVATTTTTVKVDTLPVLKVTANPNPICLGNSTTITATGANNYTWSPATGLSATTGSSVIANPTVTTTYKVIGTNSNGCVCNDSIVIIVHTPPVLSSAPATVCVGQCAPLTVTGAATYTWSPATGLSATTGSSVTACPTASTTYTITGTNTYGCVGTTTTSVTVDTLPKITVTLSSDSICAGSTDTVRPSGASSYTWKPAVFTLEGLPYVVVSPTVTTTYTVTGTNGNGCTDSTTFVVKVNPPTIITLKLKNDTVCVGNSATFTVAATGQNLTYTWQKNGVTISGNSTTLTIPSVALSDSGIYDVIVSGTCGADTSYGVLKVNQAPAITKIDVNGDTININNDTTVALCANFNQSFNITITVGGQNLTYQWFHNGSPIPNDTTVTLNINNVTVTDGGTYKVVVYGACGNDTSVTVDLNINSNTVIGSLTINDSTVTSSLDTISTCLGSSATFTVNATGTSLTYQWQFNGVNIPTATSATFIIPVTKLTDAGLYDVIVTGACNADTVYAPLKIDTKPTITGQPSNVTMCATNCKAGGVLFCVTATGVNLNYQWQFKGQNIPGANSACYGLNPATCSDTGSYRVIVSNQCGADTSNVARLELYGAPVITGQPQCATVCSGNSAQFCVTATGVGLTYQWFYNGSKINNATSSCYTASNAGCYSVVVSNSCNSVCSNIVTLTVNTPPVITCQPKGESLCSVGGKCGGNGVTFCVTATGSNLTYQWQYNNRNISGAHSSCYTIYPVVAADSGNYRVIVSNSCGADTSNCAVLTIGSAPVIIYQPQCAAVCSGNSAQFCVTATGKGLTYQWQYNGKNIYNATSSCYTAYAAGCYDVVVTNSCGSVTSCIVTLTINTPPVITCQPKSESLCSVGGKCGGNGVTFCVTATGSNLTYQWQFNGSNIHNATSSCYTINPVYTSNAGSYRVIVSNSCGADTSNCAILTIGSAPCITAQPVCTTVCAGNSTTFCVTATGTGLTYQWQFNGRNISGANSCCYTISSAATCNAGCYDVVVSNSCGSVTSCIVTLTVNTPPCITSQPTCATTCSGNNATFCVTANGTGLSYQWQFNSKNINGANSCCYTACNAGCYDVVVSNSCGSVTSNIVTLTVGTPPSITSQPVCSSVCAGNSATFCVTAVGTGLSYQWQFNGKNIGGANSCCYTISSAASCNAGCYDVVVSNSCGSVTSCTVTLTVNTPPCITTQPICLTVCAGSSTTFSVTANGSNLTYQWQYKGKNIGGANSSTYTVSSATTSEAGNYDVVVSNSCGCVTSNTVTLTVNNCSTCNTPTNLCSSDITCTGAKLSWSYSSSASSFTVEYRVHGCSTWTTVKVTTNCLTLNCLNSGTTYDWSVSENCSCGSSSSYAGVVSFCTSNNCCVNMDVAVKKVDDGSAIGELKIYPNPTFSTTTVEGNFDKESNITLLITDLSGRIIMSENETAPAGDYIHQFDMSNQPQGTYFLIIKNGDKMVTSRIVKIQ